MITKEEVDIVVGLIAKSDNVVIRHSVMLEALYELERWRYDKLKQIATQTISAPKMTAIPGPADRLPVQNAGARSPALSAATLSTLLAPCQVTSGEGRYTVDMPTDNSV